MSELPESDEDVSKWCKDIFVEKVLDCTVLFSKFQLDAQYID